MDELRVIRTLVTEENNRKIRANNEILALTDAQKIKFAEKFLNACLIDPTKGYDGQYGFQLPDVDSGMGFGYRAHKWYISHGCCDCWDPIMQEAKTLAELIEND